MTGQRSTSLIVLENQSVILFQMQKWWQKAMLFVAVATIIGHNSLPHHHHEAVEAAAHYQEHDENHDAPFQHHEDDQDTEHHHNLFSLTRLGDDFIPTSFLKVKLELPILYLPVPSITYYLSEIKEQSKTHFGYYQEYPPPGNDLSSVQLRGPPFA